jgi:hypothetical protein
MIIYFVFWCLGSVLVDSFSLTLSRLDNVSFQSDMPQASIPSGQVGNDTNPYLQENGCVYMCVDFDTVSEKFLLHIKIGMLVINMMTAILDPCLRVPSASVMCLQHSGSHAHSPRLQATRMIYRYSLRVSWRPCSPCLRCCLLAGRHFCTEQGLALLAGNRTIRSIFARKRRIDFSRVADRLQ